MKNFLTRLLTGTLYVSAITIAVLWNAYSLLLLVLLISTLAIREFYEMSCIAKKRWKLLLSIAGNFVIVCTAFLQNLIELPVSFVQILALLFLLIFIFTLLTKTDNPLQTIGSFTSSLAYISLPLSIMIFLAHDSANNYYPGFLMGTFIVIWAYDSFAYIFGSLFGKHRIMEKVSPKKSWEGFFGGAALSLLLSYPLHLLFPELTILSWIIVILIVIIMGTLGDLFESKIKRSVKIKDSGHILPGHGGMLDRIDSLLFSLPFVYLYLQIIGQ